ncbi:MAG: NAD(P)-binding domain-containing protein [Anaerolineaceae bacterium]
MTMLRIGFIGLGVMGNSMAQNIFKAGFTLTVWNRTLTKAEELVSMGAKLAATPADVARASDVVCLCLSDTPDVLEVVLGEAGVIEGAHAGMILIDHSTIKPAGSRELFAKLQEVGVESLDAPISGGDIGARNGTLSIMVGGNSEALEKVMPVLQAEGKTITHVGGPGTGQIAKAANQIMVAAQMVAEAELLIFAQKAGADPIKVIEAIRSGAAQCWTLDVKPPRLFAGNRTPGFKASLQAKDLAIIMETAREYLVALPITAVASQLFNGMVASGEGDLDNSAVLGMLERMNNETLQISPKQ